MMAPLLAVFALWVGYGLWQWRNNRALLAQMQRVPRKVRPVRAILLLIGSVGVLLLALFGLTAAGGITSKSVELWAWPVVALAGLGFVHAQVRAGALLVSLAVTDPPVEPSSDSEGLG